MSYNYLVENLKKQLADWEDSSQEETVGQIMEIGDGIARISGLSDLMMS